MILRCIRDLKWFVYLGVYSETFTFTLCTLTRIPTPLTFNTTFANQKGSVNFTMSDVKQEPRHSTWLSSVAINLKIRLSRELHRFIKKTDITKSYINQIRTKRPRRSLRYLINHRTLFRVRRIWSTSPKTTDGVSWDWKWYVNPLYSCLTNL